MTTHSLKFSTLDVFTTTPYEGNPLGVVHIPVSLRSSITKAQKQTIAREFNLSETVFLHERDDNTSSDVGERKEWDVEIFTSTEEVPFAGHPTIGTAVTILNHLKEGRGDSTGQIILRMKAGEVEVEGSHIGGQLWVSTKIPHNVRIHRATFSGENKGLPWSAVSDLIREAESKAPFVSIVKGMTFLLVRLDSLEDLATVEISNEDLGFNALLDTDEGWNESFVGRYYFVLLEETDGKRAVRARMLEQGMEDPATGSAACALASYLALTGGGRSFEIVQGVEMGRRSVIGVEVGLAATQGSVDYVKLSGTAVKIMEGSLRV